MIFQKTRDLMVKLGLPAGDLGNLPDSPLRFADGAHFRIEVPTINTAAAMEALLVRAEQIGVTINRVDETYGAFRHTKEELKAYIDLAKQYKCELNISVGPRATYDTSATRLSSQGVRISYRLRGMEQVVRAVEDVFRIAEMGGLGVLVYDEGLLWVLNELRKMGELPKNMIFKLSAHVGHGNPASFQLLKNLGADSINPVRDLSLDMIAALRAAVDTPLDVHTDNPPASGGFIRVYEAPEIVRVGAPIHLKTGNSVVAGHGQLTSAGEGKLMAEQASIVVEMLERYYPEFKQSKGVASDMSIPGQ
jgi:hypothetical protein